jgi:predicted nucleic acid-binding Zn finger protein
MNKSSPGPEGRHLPDPDLQREIEEKYGRKGKTALDAIEAGKVKKYLDFFVVEGRTAAYIVEDDFCTCGDFLYRGRACWHLLAVRIARETGSFETIDRWYQDLMEKSGKQQTN